MIEPEKSLENSLFFQWDQTSIHGKLIDFIGRTWEELPNSATNQRLLVFLGWQKPWQMTKGLQFGKMLLFFCWLRMNNNNQIMAFYFWTWTTTFSNMLPASLFWRVNLRWYVQEPDWTGRHNDLVPGLLLFYALLPALHPQCNMILLSLYPYGPHCIYSVVVYIY